MQASHYDVVVIGTGPGGEGAAMQAAKEGKTVAVVERFEKIGGGCTHWGTIPSKALRYSIFQMTEMNGNPLFREAGINLNFHFPDLRRSARRVIDQQVDMRRGFYDRNRVPVVRGQARFLDPHTIEATEETGLRHKLTADFFVIATGARPYRPPNVDFTHPRIFDSDTILDLSFTPQSITIYGAGVIGCEYTSMFRNLGCKVNLVNTRGKLLEFLDDEIIDALSYHMRERGVLIRHGESCDKVEGRDDGVVLHLCSGKQLKTDMLLWANGRTGNSDGSRPGKRRPGGQPARTARRERLLPDGRAAHLRGRRHHRLSVAGQCRLQPGTHGGPASVQFRTAKPCRCRDVPTGIYTSPEISSLGQTERELTERQGALRSRPRALQEPGPRPDHGPHGGHAQAAVSPRDAGNPRHPLLRLQRVGNHPHRPGDHVAARSRAIRCCTSSTRRSTTRRWPKPIAWRR